MGEGRGRGKCRPRGPAGAGQHPAEAATGWGLAGESCEEARSFRRKDNFSKDCSWWVAGKQDREKNRTFS